MWAVICLLIIIWALTAPSDKKEHYQNQDNDDDSSFDDFIMYDIVSDGELDGNFSDEY